MLYSRRSLLKKSMLVAFAGVTTQSAWARKEIGQEWIVGTIPDDPYSIDLMNLRMVPEEYRRKDVFYQGGAQPGTVIVDTTTRHLYVITAPNRAVRYGVAVGREGALWKGEAVVGMKARWPRWTPTASMRQKRPELPLQMPGGPGNPLGARALYLFQNGADTQYRIHGTVEPWSIGKAASSGCIRMLNEDVFELYGSVPTGAKVIVT